MRVIDKRLQVSRRAVLRSGSAATVGVAALTVGGGMLAGTDGAWAVSVKALAPETMQTLIQMARDTYPHDRLGDAYYVAAVQGYDAQAADDAALKAMIEDGVATLDALAVATHGAPYAAVGWEVDRVALLRQVEKGPLFQKLRGDLVVALYNNPEVWVRLGYEGPSAEKGGYLDRGFNDIDWL